MTSEKEYVLGTHDDEIARLGLQHRAWQARAWAAWRLAGIGPGQTVLDAGCGPGYATLDLAELVGPTGRVLAIDKSDRFLAALDDRRRRRGLDNITTYQLDLDAGEFPEVVAGYAWCRWVLSFVKDPRDVLARLGEVVKPTGSIVLHEYFDYGVWRTAPRCPEVEEFVSAAMASWRDAGGDPDIALSLPGWLEGLGFELRRLHPIVDIVERDHKSWTWLRTFIEVGRRRLVELGYLTAARSEEIWQAFERFEATPGARMITPGVLEIVAARWQ